MRNLANRSLSKKIPSLAKVTGVVKVSTVTDEESVGERYWTEAFDMSGRDVKGRRLFESFHFLAVPEGQFETFVRLRKQVKQSLVSDLDEVIQGPSQQD